MTIWPKRTPSNKTSPAQAGIAGVTAYGGILDAYFHRVLVGSIEIIPEELRNKKILDFGCGRKELSRLFPNLSITGYDKEDRLSEIANWQEHSFDIAVANHVLYSMSAEEIRTQIEEFKHFGISWLVVSESNFGVLNKIGMILFRKQDAHSLRKTNPDQIISVVKGSATLKCQKNILYLTKCFLFSLK